MKIFSGVFPTRLGKPVENAETIINIINEHKEADIIFSLHTVLKVQLAVSLCLLSILKKK